MATCGLIIIKMKADMELAIISLPVYFKSVKKWRYVLRKKQKQNKMTKKKEEKVSHSRSRTLDLRCVRSTRYLLHHDNLCYTESLNYVIFNNSAHRWCLKLVKPSWLAN